MSEWISKHFDYIDSIKNLLELADLYLKHLMEILNQLLIVNLLAEELHN